LFKTNDKNTITLCLFYCGYLPFDILFDLQRYVFLNKMIKENRTNIKTQLDSTDFHGYCLLQSKYNLNANDSNSKIKFLLKK
jgi:hypothetical protein